MNPCSGCDNFARNKIGLPKAGPKGEAHEKAESQFIRKVELDGPSGRPQGEGHGWPESQIDREVDSLVVRHKKGSVPLNSGRDLPPLPLHYRLASLNDRLKRMPKVGTRHSAAGCQVWKHSPAGLVQ